MGVPSVGEVVGVSKMWVVMQVPLCMVYMMMCHHCSIWVQFLGLRFSKMGQFMFFLPLPATVLDPDFYLSFREVQCVGDLDSATAC